MKTYAAAKGFGGGDANAEFVMDEAGAEASIEGVVPATETLDSVTRNEAV